MWGKFGSTCLPDAAALYATIYAEMPYECSPAPSMPVDIKEYGVLDAAKTFIGVRG
jgi:hypothetical protein